MIFISRKYFSYSLSINRIYQFIFTIYGFRGRIFESQEKKKLKSPRSGIVRISKLDIFNLKLFLRNVMNSDFPFSL